MITIGRGSFSLKLQSDPFEEIAFLLGSVWRWEGTHEEIFIPAQEPEPAHQAARDSRATLAGVAGGRLSL
jgi:hypothetical protein